MSALPETLCRTVETRALFPRRAKIILAVSGGADSMAMLHAMADVTQTLLSASANSRARVPALLRVAHVHHGLRGRAAEADANLVKKTAKLLGIPFHLCRANVKALAKRKQISIEMAAREVRHEFFHKLAKKYRAVVATAHTRDDQAETVLLRLLRGSGTDGLGGIEYKTKIRRLKIVRPMLDVSHDDAMDFLRERKLKWREDASNADDAMKRNRVRHELIPLLETRFNPRIREILARTASILRTDSDCLNEIAEAELTSRLESGGLKTTNPPVTAIWRRVIYRWLLHHARVAPSRLDNELVLRVETLASQTGALTLPGNIALRAEHGGLHAKRKK